jgi:uncharacterized membrane protein YgcG
MRVTMRTTVVFIIAFNVVSSCILPATAYFIESDWVTEINDIALQIDINTTAEIVVFVVPSLTGHGIKDKQGNEINDIVELGVYIFNEGELETLDGSQIGIGKPGKDNGVLVLIAVEEQQWRIEVGYGLEGDITDVESNRIAQDYLVPLFEQGNYGEGLYYTVVALGNEIPSVNSNTDSPVRGYYVYDLESTYVPEPWWATSYYGLPLWVIILLALLGIFVPIAGGKRGRGGRSGGGGSTGKW